MTDRPRGIPTARNIDHVAYTVPDLRAAVDFFVDVLGGELVYTEGPLRREDGWMAEHVDVDPRAVAEIAMIRMGPTCNVELFEYSVAGQRTTPPRNSDVGGHHLAFAVENVDAAVEYLRRAPGVEIVADPRTIGEGPIAGNRWAYFRTPVGITMEVLAMPDGSLPYEGHTASRRYPGERGGWAAR
jgi:catechol 2,3-dioxygenase-like lactoylglutathione lyase family enzyme